MLPALRCWSFTVGGPCPCSDGRIWLNIWLRCASKVPITSTFEQRAFLEFVNQTIHVGVVAPDDSLRSE
jgi:hypothetical protein